MKKLLSLILCTALLVTPCLAYYNGVDVYHGTCENAPINWTLLSHEKQFAYIKCSEKNFADNTFYTNESGAKKAGMRWGPYHFLRLNYSGRAQADYFWSRIKGTGYTLIPAVDCESYDKVKEAAVVRAVIRSFVDEFYRLSGIKPVIYTFTSYATENSLNKHFGDCKLWQSDIRGYAGKVSSWTWSAWQYSWTGRLASVKNRAVDLNYAKSEIFMPGTAGTVKVNPQVYNVKTMPHNYNAVSTRLQNIFTAQGVRTKYAVSKNARLDIESADDETHLLEVVYKGGNIYRHGYICASYVSYRYLNKWRNGSTQEIVYDSHGTQKGLLFAYDKASPLFPTTKGYVVIYTAKTDGVKTIRTGIVRYNGKFKF